MIKKLIALACLAIPLIVSAQDAFKWKKYEISFTSSIDYENPPQEVKTFEVTFTSPSGRTKTINSFWDGGKSWKARFMPDETGSWSYATTCSDQKNTGLADIKGSFTCVENTEPQDIYKHGPVIHPAGTYYLAHADGKPFFYLGCTAWNGALKSTEEEWEYYLQHRVRHNYSVIQLATTQWRGCDKSREGLVAFEGSGRIRINPEFFRLIDKRIDRINDYGLVAMPVILWTLQNGNGRELSPGYYLPDDQAILLAKYIVARYGANHVIWSLGGDGIYTGTYEQRWKTIGRSVFNGKTQGIVGQHPCGISWIGEVYKDEPWLDVIGYQSSHNNNEGTVNWITKGPMSQMWAHLPARPLINLEPNYEQSGMRINDKDVRNASLWSLFAAPLSGVTYGAGGIWPWLREGEKVLNHNTTPGVFTWKQSLDLPGSVQMGYIAAFLKNFEWWNLYPAQELLAEQPGNTAFNHFISVVKTNDNKLIMVYNPAKQKIKIRKPVNAVYSIRWFDPAGNKFMDDAVSGDSQVLTLEQPFDNDAIMVMTYSENPVKGTARKKQ